MLRSETSKPVNSIWNKEKLPHPMEGSSSGLMKLRSRNFVEGPSKTTKVLSQYSLCTGRDSNRAPFKCKSKRLPLGQPVR
jgi:hypothetical protein